MKLKPFDSSLREDYSMYDNLPYEKDVDLCGPDKIALESGNLIKYYRCNIRDYYQITGVDDLFYEKLKYHERQQKKQMEQKKSAIEKIADDFLPEDTMETIENPPLAEQAEAPDSSSFDEEVSDSGSPAD